MIKAVSDYDFFSVIPCYFITASIISSTHNFFIKSTKGQRIFRSSNQDCYDHINMLSEKVAKGRN